MIDSPLSSTQSDNPHHTPRLKYGDGPVAKFSRDAPAERFSQRTEKRSAIASRLNLASDDVFLMVIYDDFAFCALARFWFMVCE